MSILNNFRKPGGFNLLVQLIELSEPEKQNKLLFLVATEDPGWAHLAKLKALTVEKILLWPEETLADVLTNLQPPILAAIYFSMNDDLKHKLNSALSFRTKREVREHIKKFGIKPAESFSAGIKLIQTVRHLEAKGELNIQKIDPSLAIDQKIAS